MYWFTHRSTMYMYMKFENKQSQLRTFPTELGKTPRLLFCWSEKLVEKMRLQNKYCSYSPVLWDSWKSVFVLNLQCILWIIKKSKFVKEKTPGMIERWATTLKMLEYSHLSLKIGWKYKCPCLFVVSIVLFCNFCKSMLKYSLIG